MYRDKVIWQAQFGVMNNSEVRKRKPTANSIFPVASVSKVFTVRTPVSKTKELIKTCSTTKTVPVFFVHSNLPHGRDYYFFLVTRQVKKIPVMLVT